MLQLDSSSLISLILEIAEDIKLKTPCYSAKWFSDSAGSWWADVPSWERPFYPAWLENKETIMKRWDKRFGDRINELVIIGQDLDKEAIIEELEECLCVEEEIVRMQNKGTFIDPFPVFQ